MARHTANKKTEDQTAAAPPRRSTPWWPLRASLALAICAAALLGFRYYLTFVQANMLSRKGGKTMDNPNALIVGLGDVRRALRQNPNNPDNQYRMAVGLIRFEAQKIRAEDYRSIDFDSLSEALKLLREAQKSHVKPHFVQLKFGEAANLVVKLLEATGRKEQSREYVAQGISNFVAFRNQQGLLRDQWQTYFRTAVDISKSDPAITLLFHDDYTINHPTEAANDRELLLRAAQAHSWLGEFHLLMADLGRLLSQNPADERILGLVRDAAVGLGQRDAAVTMLAALENNGKLDPKGRALLESLRTPPAAGAAPPPS